MFVLRVVQETKMFSHVPFLDLLCCPWVSLEMFSVRPEACRALSCHSSFVWQEPAVVVGRVRRTETFSNPLIGCKVCDSPGHGQ